MPGKGSSGCPRGSCAVTLLAIGICMLIYLPWEHNIDSTFEWVKDDVPGAGELVTDTYIREVVTISSHDETLEGWLYRPKGVQRPPVVIMGHGMGVQKDMGLHPYADGFASAGMAVLAFDYRTFGGSTGTPRNWVSPRRHVQDWKAVVQHVLDTSLDGKVNASRVALWGVSYAGGHSLMTAAHFGKAISGVVACEPYLSPHAIFKDKGLQDASRMLRLLAAGISDEVRRLLGMPPVYVRLAAPMSKLNTTLALLPLQDSEVSSGPQPVKVRQGNWTNKALARIVLEAIGYNPSAQLHKVACPVFLRVGLRDHLCPPSVVRAAAEKLRHGYVLHERDATHLGAHKIGAEPKELAPVVEFLWEQFDPEGRVHEVKEEVLGKEAGVEVHAAPAS